MRDLQGHEKAGSRKDDQTEYWGKLEKMDALAR
jgi:hypothetical protein